jgi:hypothetical protein
MRCTTHCPRPGRGVALAGLLAVGLAAYGLDRVTPVVLAWLAHLELVLWIAVGAGTAGALALAAWVAYASVQLARGHGYTPRMTEALEAVSASPALAPMSAPELPPREALRARLGLPPAPASAAEPGPALAPERAAWPHVEGWAADLLAGRPGQLPARETGQPGG